MAVARALVARPEVLLLDEATAQLDALTEAAVTAGVRGLVHTGAVVSVAGRLSTVTDADQIVVLDAGRCAPPVHARSCWLTTSSTPSPSRRCGSDQRASVDPSRPRLVVVR